jgi:hypothetical protein
MAIYISNIPLPLNFWKVELSGIYPWFGWIVDKKGRAELTLP